MLQACRKLVESALSSPLATLSLHFFLTLPVLSRFPSVLICLFHRVCRSTICKILANPRKFVGFKFICKAFGLGFSDFYTVAFYTESMSSPLLSYTISNGKDIYVILSISEIEWDETVSIVVSVRYLTNERILARNSGINWAKPRLSTQFFCFLSCPVIEGYHTTPTPRHSGKRNLSSHGRPLMRLAHTSPIFFFFFIFLHTRS